ncbi:glycosyltransferase [Persephonella sp. KM09-Lau-8]|uniref:glycosyltransferase n=1 Tax=Persephonella sp. KM09-Lau-8 TaxID=1158345 RepID=UPI00056CF7EB|nr:glycosyltransferase [Persephonella sp. KM09-Lau-8]
MKVCAIVVTYGDRFKYLKQVINACFQEGVDKIIVIDNASEENSRSQLKKYEAKNKHKLKVIHLDENTGSAGGYKRGLKEAYNCRNCEYIWLLDDDNQPQKNSLRVLKEFWNDLKQEDKKEKISLLSYRPDRVQYKEAIMTNNPNLVLGRKNSFLGFHILDLPKKIIRILKRKMGLSTFKENPNIKSGKVAVAPYGGMFFHKNLIDNIGHPREEFFLYADDHEWSYRITKSGGSIYLVLDSKLRDIHASWNVLNKKETSFQVIAKGDPFRIYYSVRNRIIFEIENIVTNNLIYSINRKIFRSLVKNSKIKNKESLKSFDKAINDGLNKKTGKFNEDTIV